MKAIFDKNCYPWESNLDYNVLYVRSVEEYLNEKLKLRGYVTIFEVYESLGLALDLERLKSVKNPSDLWWTYDGKNEIDFRMTPIENGNVIYLDFNINID